MAKIYQFPLVLLESCIARDEKIETASLREKQSVVELLPKYRTWPVDRESWFQWRLRTTRRRKEPF